MSVNYNGKVRGNFQRSYDQKEMTFEEERIKTFKAWSKTCQVAPDSLAKAGFFYVGIFDRVKCFSCGGQIEGWEEGDTAMDEHKKMYPHCHMVKNQDKRNVTIEKWNEMKKRLGQRTEEVDGEIVWGKHKTLTSDECVEAFCETSYERLSSALKPLFGGELDRLDTFRDNWSEEFKLPSSETRWLANAGFYYTGPGDRARCFYCYGGIENWEEDDEPWSEHARNFPNCEWLKEMIGENFVDEVQDFFKNAKASEEAEKREPKQNPAVSTPSSPSDRQKTASVAVSAHMDSPTVQTIVKAGYDPALVRRVIEAQLHVRETDLNFSSSDNFIKTLDAAEKGKNSTDEKPVEHPASTNEPQTQQFANLEIKGVPRREESPVTKSDQKSCVTARSPEHKQFSSTASSPGYLPDVGPNKVLCRVCKEQDVATILYPCNHEVACLPCTRVANTCPQCATHITNYRRISCN